MTKQQIRTALERLENITRELQGAEVISIIDTEISGISEQSHKPHYEAFKAHKLWQMGLKRDAVDLLEQQAREYPDLEKLSYHAGEYLIELGEFARAIECLTLCVDTAESLKDDWYLSAAYLLRAYSAAKLGKQDLAAKDLSKVDDVEPLGWIRVEPIISKASIQAMISHNAK